MSKVVAATLLGPHDPAWAFCHKRAAEWADEHVIVHDKNGEAWGNEGVWRQRLWREAVEACGKDKNAWIFILDSDFLLTFDPHDLTDSYADTWRFDLYDAWSTTHYREDHMWCAHMLPRHWMFRASVLYDEPAWVSRGIHNGHFPLNFPVDRQGLSPSRYSILHLGWITPEIRQEKYERYASVRDQLTPQEWKHVESILDPEPNLREFRDTEKAHLAQLDLDKLT